MKKRHCSIIILSFNTKYITNKCLNHLKKSIRTCQKKLNNKLEVIVIDNNSQDGSPELIEKKHPWVCLIRSRENLGFAKANNLGMKKAKYNFLLLLNSDCFVRNDTLWKAIKSLEENSQYDVLGCQLRYQNGEIQPSAGFLPTPIRIFAWMTGIDKLPFLSDLIGPIHPGKINFFQKKRPVEWVTGAFFLLRKSVFQKTEGFDENYFMYGEEVEWCKRIKKKKIKILFDPSFNVVHLKGASGQFDIEKPLVKEIIGLKYFCKKHYPRSLWFVEFSILFGCLIRVIAFSLLNNQKKKEVYFKILKKTLCHENWHHHC